MFDSYAMTYLFFVCVVLSVSLLRAFLEHDTLRLWASLFMLMGWALTNAAQLFSGDYTPVVLFIIWDFVITITFGLLAWGAKKMWVWPVAAFHLGILGLNVIYVASGQSSAFWFITSMTANIMINFNLFFFIT